MLGIPLNDPSLTDGTFTSIGVTVDMTSTLGPNFDVIVYDFDARIIGKQWDMLMEPVVCQI